MKIKILIIFTFIINFYNFSENIEKKWDINNDFNNSLFIKKNVELNYINNIPVNYSLKREKYKISSDTDLYLSFDKIKNFDETGNYKFIYNKYHPSKDKAVYDKSAYFIRDKERIELIGTEKSFFQSGTTLGSFSISFWLYTSTFSNDEIVLKIGSEFYNKKLDTVEDQSILAKMKDGKLLWEFNNIFSTSEIKIEQIKLESYSRIIPEKWTHINLVYDSHAGIIREYINEKEDGIVITTVDKTLNSSVLNLQYHHSNRCVIIIAPSFYGAIDEFYITKKPEKIFTNKYIDDTGEIISKVEDFGTGGVFIYDIKTLDFKEKNSNIIYYYRYSDKPFDENDEISNEIKWNKIGSEDLSNKNIRFFQWKVTFLAGDNRNYSPKFRGLSISYNLNAPPAKPFGLKILYDNEKILIKWKLNSEKDLKGYKIYYGTKSNYYFGKEANQGESPIDVGMINTYEITGLKKNIIYYFTVTAYDDDEHIHESEFSDEVSIRPL